MTKVEDLRILAQTIKNETKVGGNTAERVGNAFEGVADALEGNEQKINDISKNTINKKSIEQTAGNSESSVMSQKAVTDALKKVGVKTTDGKTLQDVYELAQSASNKREAFDVNYDNSRSHISASNVQEAIDNNAKALDDAIYIYGNEDKIGGCDIKGGVYQGYGCIYAEKIFDHAMLVTNIRLFTAYTGNAYVLIGTITDKKFTTAKVFQVALNGKDTDISNYNIVLPKGYYIGICGISSCFLGNTYGSSLLKPSFFIPANYTPAVGKVISSVYSYTIDAEILFREKVAKDIYLSDIPQLKEDIKLLEKKTAYSEKVIKLGDDQDKWRGSSLQKANYLWLFAYTNETPLYLTKIYQATSHSQVPTEQDVTIAICSINGSKCTVDKLYSVHLNASAETDVSDINIIIPPGKRVGIIGEATFTYSGVTEKGYKPQTLYYGNYYANSEISLSSSAYMINYGFELSSKSDFTSVINTLKEEKTPDKVGIEDTTSIVCFGSSYTEGIYQPKGFSWMERLNDMLDLNFINSGASGMGEDHNIMGFSGGGISRFGGGVSVLNHQLHYVLYGNSANGGVWGADAYKQMKDKMEIAMAYGAKVLLSDEEGGNTHTPSLIIQNRKSLAKEFGVPYVTSMWETIKCHDAIDQGNASYTSRYPYKGWFSNSHSGYRANAPYNIKYDWLHLLPIKKSVKMFKVRPAYKGGTPKISDLNYDDNWQRLRYWVALSCGSASHGGGYVANAGNTGHMDNLDSSDSKYSVDGEDLGGNSKGEATCEVGTMISGGDITFKKFALIEFILDKIQVKTGVLKFKCNTKPTNIYVAKAQRGGYEPKTRGSVRSEFINIKYTYADNYVIAEIVRSLPDIQLYDKVRFVVECNGEFTIAEPSFYGYDGRDKMLSAELPCFYRKYGEELNPETSINNGWLLDGNVLKKSFPALIANYSGYNSVKSHLEFVDNSATATKVIPIKQPINKVAIRIICQSFCPIVTTRFASGSDFIDGTKVTESAAKEVRDSGYVVTSNQVKNWDYDYGTIKMLINGEIIRKHIVMQGWSEVYFEVDIQPNIKELSIQLSRDNYINNDYLNTDRPLMVHDVSVQKIE